MSRPRIASGRTYISQLPRISLDEGGQVSPASFSYLIGVIKSIINRLNGHISLGIAIDGVWTDNLDGQWRLVTFPAAADTAYIIEHGLERVPSGWIDNPLSAAVLYATSADRASWGETTITLRSSVGGASAFLVLY